MRADEEENIREAMRSFGERVTGPIVYAFTSWVICKAKERGIKTVWFLARDGYLPYLMAKEICSLRGIDIACRYFYCSRSSLRSSSLHLVDDAELEGYMLTRGYHTGADTLFSRLEVSEEKRKELIINTKIENPSEPLSRADFTRLCELIRDDGEIFDALRSSSKEKYAGTAEYIKQSGILNEDCVCIVDSGWTGSMQRSLRILFDTLGYRGKIVGLYFGMYRAGKLCDGEYLTYYFNTRCGILRRVFFNNNVFECMLSAPHPMTCGYSLICGTACPKFAADHEPKVLEMITSQIGGALKYCKRKNKENLTKYRADMNLRKISKTVRGIMVYPTRRDVALLSRFMFCDDFTEQYKLRLADVSVTARMRELLLFSRILRRIIKKNAPFSEPLWSYGAVAYLPAYQRAWYRMNLIVWELFKAARERLSSQFFGG